jgi:hypothetical protein
MRPGVDGLGWRVTRSDMYGWGILVVQTKFNSFEHLCTTISVKYDMAIECHQVDMLMEQGCKMMIGIEVKRVERFCTLAKFIRSSSTLFAILNMELNWYVQLLLTLMHV